MNPVLVRQANQADLPSLEWDGEYAHFRRLYADAFTMVVQGNAIIWIAEQNGSGLIGQLFVSLMGNRLELADGVTRAYIYGFRIRPQYRNQGIGTMIMHTVEADLKRRGFRQITLNVGQENHSARRFYDRLGYIVVGPDPGRWYYIDDKGKRRDVIEPAWRMIKDLG
jgi:ribosomal protein S18 acetylase RimI-like enzyme